MAPFGSAVGAHKLPRPVSCRHWFMLPLAARLRPPMPSERLSLSRFPHRSAFRRGRLRTSRLRGEARPCDSSVFCVDQQARSLKPYVSECNEPCRCWPPAMARARLVRSAVHRLSQRGGDTIIHWLSTCHGIQTSPTAGEAMHVTLRDTEGDCGGSEAEESNRWNALCGSRSVQDSAPSRCQQIDGVLALGPNTASLKGRRDVHAYNALIQHAINTHKAYLLQDIYLEMQLDGVSPNWQTFSTALYGTMRQRLLHDCLYFFQEMQRCGFSPTSKSYAVLINAAGRVGQFSYANKVLEDMMEKSIPVDDRVLRAMTNACSASGDAIRAIEFLEEMLRDFPEATDIHVFAETTNAFRQSAPRLTSHIERKQAASRIGELVTKAAETFDLDMHPDDRDVVLKAAMHAYEAIGHHPAVCDAFAHVSRPDEHCYNVLVASHIATLTPGNFRQAHALLEEMEQKRFRLMIPNVMDFVSAGLRLSCASTAELEAYDPVVACLAVLEHVNTSGQFLGSRHGRILLGDCARAREAGHKLAPKIRYICEKASRKRHKLQTPWRS